jgi:hypothetical protein
MWHTIPEVGGIVKNNRNISKKKQKSNPCITNVHSDLRRIPERRK